MAIETMTFQEKVELLKELLDDLDIILTAAYGASGYISSSNIEVYDETRLYIHTDICTG